MPRMQTPTNRPASRCVSHVRHMLLAARHTVTVRGAVLIAVLLAAAGCGGPTDYACVHESGFRAQIDPQSPDCAEFRSYVSRALNAFAKHVREPAFARDRASETLHFYAVEQDQTTARDGSMPDYEPQYGRVSGLTWCDYHKSVVNYYWGSSSSLAHEMAHGIENCLDTKHSTWEARGIYAAINEVETQPQATVAP